MVELGEYDISGNNEIMSTRQAKVKRVVVHKDYVQPTFENDIAILELVFAFVVLRPFRQKVNQDQFVYVPFPFESSFFFS